MYADGYSFIKAFKPIDHKILTVHACDIKHISNWMHQNHVKMNDGNTEFITFGTGSCLKKEDLPELRVGDDVVKAQTP